MPDIEVRPILYVSKPSWKHLQIWEVKMSVTGKFTEYNEDVEDFESYMERIDLYFKANAVKAETKVPMFLTVIGSKTYGILRNLLSPDKPSEKTMEELTKVLKEHFAPKKSIVAERCKFHKRFQKEGESLAEYAVAIKQMASACEFNTFLKDAMRDRFVSGIRCQEIQQRLMTEEDKSFDELYALALRLEEAKVEVKRFHNQEMVSDVNLIKHRYNKNFPKQGSGFGNKSGQVKSDYRSNEKFNKTISHPACFRCGRSNHSPNQCRYRQNQCFSCLKYGHLANMCKSPKGNVSRPKSRFRSVNQVGLDDEEVNASRPNDNTQTNSEYDLYSVSLVNEVSLKNSFTTSLVVNDQKLEMMIDTGAAVTLIPQVIFEDKFKNVKLHPTSMQLQAYSGHKINLLGEFKANVAHQGVNYQLPMIVTADQSGKRPVLLGRNWLEVLRLDWSTVHQVSMTPKEGNQVGPTQVDHKFEVDENSLKNKFNEVFYGPVGSIKSIETEIIIDEQAVPIFCKARSLPYAMHDLVNKEIDNLVKDNIIYPVSQSEWATPLVCILKPDGKSVRLCADFKVTLNKFIKNEHYPLPSTEDIFAKLAGGKVFSKIDLKSAYLQLNVGLKSQPLLTVNTHRGLFRFRKLPFGISSAPFAFQSAMDKVLQGLEGTYSYLDDILVVGSSYQDAVIKTEATLQRLLEYGVKANPAKSELLKTSLKFLGYNITAEGIKPSEHLVQAVLEAPEPTNVDQLRAFCGLINFYGKFLPQLSTVLHPLYELMQANRPWVWSSECCNAFNKCKSMLAKSQVLVPFDPMLPLQVTTDASSYGLGAVLAHKMKNGTVRPIMFASRTLTKAEVKYAQLDKEALAIIFAVKKFHKYLIAKHFELVTDHRPLVVLFGERKAIPILAAARMQRWAVILSAYDYHIVYKKGSEIVDADALSRLPLKVHNPDDDCVNFFAPFPDVPITAREIMIETRKDPTLARALDFTQHGWPERFTEPNLQPYFIRRTELTVENGCLLWGNRVIIPMSLRPSLLELFHEEHPGICRMKALARGYVWWPKLDSDIELLVNKCSVCQATRKSAPEVQLQPWTWPNRRFYRVHMDFATKNGIHFLIVTDSYSKWVEVYVMGSTNAEKTIEKLRSCFASFGCPEKVVTDGGPPFQSEEMNNFFIANGITHTFSPAYHPKSNGQAESYVGTFKTALLKQIFHDKKTNQKRSIQHRVDCFLFSYRNTPHTTTGKTPAELFLGFKPRTRLTLLKPHLSSTVEKNQEKMKTNYDKNRNTRYFRVGQEVLVRSVRQEEIKWMPGTIKKVVSPMTYLVNVCGKTRFCHADHIKEGNWEELGKPIENHPDPNYSPIGLHLKPLSPSLERPTISPTVVKDIPDKQPVSSSPEKSIQPQLQQSTSPKTTTRKVSPEESVQIPEETPLRKSTRRKCAPQRLNL